MKKAKLNFKFGLSFLAATCTGYAATTSICITAKGCFLFCVHGFNFYGEEIIYAILSIISNRFYLLVFLIYLSKN